MVNIDMNVGIKSLAFVITLTLVTHAQAVGNGQVISGSGFIVRNGNNIEVKQNSKKMIVNWDNMDIGQKEMMVFYQAGSDAVLNKITNTKPTVIQGALNASGKVFIVNPNGVLFSKGATVNVGSLVASSLDITNEDFNRGKPIFFGKGDGKVINEGSITAYDDDVVLLGGSTVANTGTINSKRGDVVMATGSNITLSSPAWGGMSVAIERGSLNALVENGGIITSSDGSVLLTAWATDKLTRSVINNSGTIEASGLALKNNGRIQLISDRGTGDIDVSGTLKNVRLGDGITIRGNNIIVHDGTVLKSRNENRLFSTAQDGYVKVGNVDFVGDNDILNPNKTATMIRADNILSNESTKNSSFGDTLTLTSVTGNITLSEQSVSDLASLKTGDGVVSADLLDAVARSNTSLRVEALGGNINYNHGVNKLSDLKLLAQNGAISINGRIDNNTVTLNAAKGINQSVGSSINAAGDINIILGQYNPHVAKFLQKADIISGQNINITSSGYVAQGEGTKTSAAGLLSVNASNLRLNGHTQVREIALKINGDTMQGKHSSITSHFAKINGSDVNLSNGDNHIDDITINADNFNLASAGDVAFTGQSWLKRGLTVIADHNVSFDSIMNINGNARILAGGDVSVPAVLTVFNNLNITANNILTTGKNKVFTDITAKDFHLIAKNNVDLTDVRAFEAKRNMNVKAGHDANFDGHFSIAGDANITAKDNATFKRIFITGGKRNVSATNVVINSFPDVSAH